MDYSPLASSVNGFPKQENWSELPFPSPGDLPLPGIKPMSLALADRFFISLPPGKPHLVQWPRNSGFQMAGYYTSVSSFLNMPNPSW